jgi:hypothetical protein
MFVGTGLTHGWRGWLREGRKRQPLGQYDWTKVKQDSSDVSTTAVDGNPDPIVIGPTSGRGGRTYRAQPRDETVRVSIVIINLNL